MNTQHWDPRMGDEPTDGHTDDRAALDDHARGQKHVRLNTYSSEQDLHKKEAVNVPDFPTRNGFVKEWRTKPIKVLASHLQWVSDNWTWPKLKPVIRSATAGWVSVLFILITPIERRLGTASFLLLLSAFTMPPNDPFIAVLEREVIMLSFVTLAWAWSCLGIFLANLARSHFDRSAPMQVILTGKYIEAAPTVIMAVFLFLGCSFYLYIKARQGPGLYLFATIFSCVCVDISLTTAPLFPYPYYKIGQSVVLPLAIHSGLSILFSIILFPSTITAQTMRAVGQVLDPLDSALTKHRQVLKMSPYSPEFVSTVSSIRELVDKAEGGLGAAGLAFRLISRDIIWGRFAPADIGDMQWLIRRLVTRANGMGIYFTLIDPMRERFPVTPAPSAPGSPVAGATPLAGVTPIPSRPPSPTLDSDERGSQRRSRFPEARKCDSGASAGQGSRRRRLPDEHKHSQSRTSFARQLHHSLHRHRHHTQHDNTLHLSLLDMAHSLSLSRVSTAQSSVGVFESQRYLTLEATRLSHAASPETTAHFTNLLSESCDELTGECQAALKAVKMWVAGVRRSALRRKKSDEEQEKVKALEDRSHALKVIIERFRKEKRLRVLDPYRCAFDSKGGTPGGADEAPPHKYLFHCFVYEYHLMRFGLNLLEMLESIIGLENSRQTARLWTPTIPIRKFFTWSRWETADMDRTDDEDPDVIPGIEPEWQADLGLAARRDPDALPPENVFELVMYALYRGIKGLTRGNALFSLKAGILTIVLSIPSLLKHTAHFAYAQRFVWAIVMGQLTLARFRGDTTFGLVSRVLSTFFGCLVALAMWYISAGNGRGNAYGLAATCAVCFPFFFYARLYWPGPPMLIIVFFLTIGLVLGFSWQDTHLQGAFSYFGWNVAWRRFTLVTVGVTAAFIFSYLPPSTTLRGHQRRMMSTTVAEIGSLYCQIVSFANTKGRNELDKGPIIQSLIAIRLKLKRSLVLKTNIVYEFSLRGKWPAERYHKILELQLQIAFLLSHLMSVVEQLEPAWSRAFLRRTRFLESDFQGDVLAVISMISTALRTGNPLPQITPCPLLDRFMAYTHGLNVIRQEADDDYGLPRTMTIDTLENEQYMCFSVGATTAFGIVMRLDRLMVATKELVGEQYHIHGVGLPNVRTFADQQDSTRPAKDV